MTKVTYPSGMMGYVTSLGKGPRPYEVLAEVKRNTECVIEMAVLHTI